MELSRRAEPFDHPDWVFELLGHLRCVKTVDHGHCNVQNYKVRLSFLRLFDGRPDRWQPLHTPSSRREIPRAHALRAVPLRGRLQSGFSLW